MIQRGERGFTLTELLIVMVILGVMAAIAAPNLRPLLSRDKLRASTASVTSSLYMARTRSVNDGARYGVRFLSTGEFYVVKDPKGSMERFGASYLLDDGISIVRNTFVNDLVIFNEYGQLDRACLPTGSLAGAIVLSNDTTDSTRIEVGFISGRIRETTR